MSIRVGSSWRTGKGRRSWVSMPLWLLPPYVAVVIIVIGAVATLAGAAWIVVQSARGLAWAARFAYREGGKLCSSRSSRRSSPRITT